MHINYQQIGDKNLPPVVFIHGLFGNYKNLTVIAKGLSDKFCCYLLDLPNHGLSDKMPDCDLYNFAKQINLWALSIGLKNAHYIGHSLGGKIIMSLAINFTGLVNGITVIDMAPKDYPRSIEFDQIFTAINNIIDNKIEDKKQANLILQKYIDNQAVRLFLLSGLRKTNGVYDFLFAGKILDAGRDKWRLNPVKNTDIYTGKALFLYGELSNFVTEIDQQTIKIIFTQATLKKVKKAGHWVHADNPKDTIKYIDEFLSSI